MVRLDRAHHRPVAGDSPLAEAVKLLARVHQTLIWDRQRAVLRLRAALLEFFPAALDAFDDLTAADPQSKGGSEASVRIAKADLVPTQANLRADYGSFAELEAACREFCDQVNARAHRMTGRAPADMLAEERVRLHRLPAAPFTTALGVTRRVDATALVAFEAGRYSVPHQLAGQTVWVRRHGEQVVIVHVGTDGPVEVARHALADPGSPRITDAHYPPAPAGPLELTSRAKDDR